MGQRPPGSERLRLWMRVLQGTRVQVPGCLVIAGGDGIAERCQDLRNRMGEPRSRCGGWDGCRRGRR